MILKKLIMHNFGVYADTNQFDFHGEKPVVLVGGMNGRGKTTFLEAVLLGLYGSNSFAYTENKYKTYGQYLRSYVNKSDGTLFTYIEIEFSMDDSDEEIYFVHREWNAKSQRVREKIKVMKNGTENTFLTENWPMFVENILPSALSNFFFFDGEKIAELAVENTNHKMKESIKALLGISVLDLLDNDLGRIITKLSDKDSEDQNLRYLELLRQKRENAHEDLKAVDAEIERVEEKLDGLRIELEKKNTEYSVKGGDIVEQRHDLMAQRSEAVATVESQQDILLEMATGAMPMMLVRSLLKDIQKQGEAEQSYRASCMATKKINSLYEDFLKKYPNTGDEIQKFIEYVKTESELQQQEEIYRISDTTLYQITALNKGGLISEKEKVISHMHRRNACQSKIDEIDNYLSVDIDEKALRRIFKQIKSLEMEIVAIEVELEVLKQKRTTFHSSAMIAETEFSKAAEQVLSSLETMDDDNRTVKYAHMAINIIRTYKIRLQQSKTEILAQTVTECYKQLANKKNLIDKITMDPETLDLHYLNAELEEVEKKSLSAGEKQLMVISLLWALAICSKKKLPVIIDTPLSRLDSVHREALITTYFPKASDQTIILSTDSEIDEKYYLLMKPSVGDEFTLVYDDELKKTTIQKGYLFFGGKR
ncbi:DNA sulfur modification protein DndD [Mediterraneibacter agrestimuris]|uniref:DNA sulfur modification protein DndD n=1 Tax=Mediterraneibacter agrestimuris TaxID=2941333 RepID=UPI00203D56FC|nr:DNA sulfur modification protein DndD [Mediterraneibacter agrestimuris]